MAGDDLGEELREAALHRGLKLIKSRRRKPGTGDFGRFGLTDASGKHLLGFGKNGLTATADDIAAYLRKGAAATWAESARTTPAPGKGTRAVRKRAPKTIAPEDAPPPRRAPITRPASEPGPQPVEEAQSAEPALVVRKATAGDAGAIAALIDADAGEVAAVLRGKTSVLVAQRADIIGCVAWQAIPTLQHGLIGRLTLIFVANDERRRKVGSALVEAARTELAKLGCALIEAISDIEIDNAHGFFRALGFNQASYRFTID